jgi:hypothetical protein
LITYTEYIAFLEDAERIRGELAALAPDQKLPRLNEILEQSPRPYRSVMLRLLLDYHEGVSFARAVETFRELRDRDREQIEPPKNFAELLWRLFKERRWLWFVLVILVTLLTWFWSSLPDEMKMRILEGVLCRDRS